LQVFRDLFADEALRPGERISVGSLTVVFTDLYGSTELYNQIGDATAFGLVMSHFDVLNAAITAEGGAQVKTMGDAVMAVCQRPLSALHAMLRAQEELASLVAGDGPFRLKVGMHYGPCIAVTLNGQLDYFGSTVNIAARLEGLSQGGDLVVSAAVHDDLEVADFLGEHEEEFEIEKLDFTLKGFYEERFSLKRIRKAN
jgi:class 3 adenylate cyclase